MFQMDAVWRCTEDGNKCHTGLGICSVYSSACPHSRQKPFFTDVVSRSWVFPNSNVSHPSKSPTAGPQLLISQHYILKRTVDADIGEQLKKCTFKQE